jgi:hypothetical protein
MTEAYGSRVAPGDCSNGGRPATWWTTWSLLTQGCTFLQVVNDCTLTIRIRHPIHEPPLLLIRTLRLEAMQTLSRLRTSTG